MPTDAKTGQSIFGHHASLYSRNRRPFGLTDNRVVPEKCSVTTVTTVAAGALVDNLSDSGDPEKNGYATGNARYLHLQIENDGTGDTLKLYAYSYVFGAWAELYINIGVGDTETAVAAYVPAIWTTINGKFMITVPIHGIDRIGFVNDGTLGNMVVRAATSTF